MKRIRAITVLMLIAGCTFLVRVAIVIQSEPALDDDAVPIRLPSQFDSYSSQIEKLCSCQVKKSAPQTGDWLAKFPEGGQTFRQYVKRQDLTPLHENFHGIDLQPLGEFDGSQKKLLAETAELFERFFGVPVTTLEPVALDEIPQEAVQKHNGIVQVDTKWIMNHCLIPRRRPDSLVTIGLVTCDLWTGNFNWLFGEAITSDRVAVWSLYRMSDPQAGNEQYRRCLLRTVKTGVHEIGHALGMPHCGQFECGMNGTRSLEEHDRRWLEFCPECQATIWWTCGADPIQRCRSLSEFCDLLNWDREAKLFRTEQILLQETPRN